MHASSFSHLHFHFFPPFQSPRYYILPVSLKPSKNHNFFPTAASPTSFPLSSKPLLSKSSPNISDSNPPSLDDAETDFLQPPDPDPETATSDGVQIEVEKTGENRRRIRSRIGVDASLETVWKVLTDYERLSDFIPGLAVSQLLEKKENFARLFQIGRQNLAFGLKFNAKGVVDCYEKDLVLLPFGQIRDIEFKMIEGDFKIFEGKWSIVQADDGRCEEQNELSGFESVLLYEVDVEPKMWLPVGLVEGRLCKEIEVNLTCIREEAHRLALQALGSSYQ